MKLRRPKVDDHSKVDKQSTIAECHNPEAAQHVYRCTCVSCVIQPLVDTLYLHTIHELRSTIYALDPAPPSRYTASHRSLIRIGDVHYHDE